MVSNEWLILGESLKNSYEGFRATLTFPKFKVAVSPLLHFFKLHKKLYLNMPIRFHNYQNMGVTELDNYNRCVLTGYTVTVAKVSYYVD